MRSANRVFVVAFVLATVLLASGQLREWAGAAADYAAECIGLQEPAEAQTFNAIGNRLLRGISTTDPRCTTPCCRSPACGPGQTFSCPSPRQPTTRRQCLGCATDNAPQCPGGLDPQCTGTPANSRWVCPDNPTEACPETRPTCSFGNPTCSGAPGWTWSCPAPQTRAAIVAGCDGGATLDMLRCRMGFAGAYISHGSFSSCGAATLGIQRLNMDSRGGGACEGVAADAGFQLFAPNTAQAVSFTAVPSVASVEFSVPAPATFSGSSLVANSRSELAVAQQANVYGTAGVTTTGLVLGQGWFGLITANPAFLVYSLPAAAIASLAAFFAWVNDFPVCRLILGAQRITFTSCSSTGRSTCGTSRVIASAAIEEGHSATFRYHNGSGSVQSATYRCTPED